MIFGAAVSSNAMHETRLTTPETSRRSFIAALPLALAALPALARSTSEKSTAPNLSTSLLERVSPHLLNFGHGPCIGLGGDVVLSTAHQGIPSQQQGRRPLVHQLRGANGELCDLVLFRMRGLQLPMLEIAETDEIPQKSHKILVAAQRGSGIGMKEMLLMPHLYGYKIGDPRFSFRTDCHAFSEQFPQKLALNPSDNLSFFGAGASGSAVLLHSQEKTRLLGVSCLVRAATGMPGDSELGFAADVTIPSIRAQIGDFLSGKISGSLITPTMRSRAANLGEIGLPIALLFCGFILSYLSLGPEKNERGEQKRRRERLDLKVRY